MFPILWKIFTLVGFVSRCHVIRIWGWNLTLCLVFAYTCFLFTM